MRDDNELEWIGFFFAIKLDLVRLELLAPMKRVLKSLDIGSPLKFKYHYNQCVSHQSLRRVLIFNSNI
ncbi:hypothetical protein HpBGD97_14220 [Helicobacter pylori]